MERAIYLTIWLSISFGFSVENYFQSTIYNSCKGRGCFLARIVSLEAKLIQRVFNVGATYFLHKFFFGL